MSRAVNIAPGLAPVAPLRGLWWRLYSVSVVKPRTKAPLAAHCLSQIAQVKRRKVYVAIPEQVKTITARFGDTIVRNVGCGATSAVKTHGLPCCYVRCRLHRHT